MYSKNNLDKFLGPEQYVLYLVMLDFLHQTDALNSELKKQTNLTVDFKKFRYAMYETGLWPIIKDSIDNVVNPVANFDSNSINSLKHEAENNHRTNLVRNSLIMVQLAEISKAFHEESIDFILLKGSASLLSGLWESMEDRALSDIDILVRNDKTAAASKVLLTLGYNLDDTELDWFRDHHHLPPFRHPSSTKIPIEIHRRVGIPRCDPDLPVDEVFDSRITLKNDTGTFYILSNEHQLALAKLHGSQQLKNSRKYYFPLKDLLELFLLTNKTPAANHKLLHCDDLMMQLFMYLYGEFFYHAKKNHTDANLPRYLQIFYRALLRLSFSKRLTISLDEMHLARIKRKPIIGALNDSPLNTLLRFKKSIFFTGKNS